MAPINNTHKTIRTEAIALAAARKQRKAKQHIFMHNMCKNVAAQRCCDYFATAHATDKQTDIFADGLSSRPVVARSVRVQIDVFTLSLSRSILSFFACDRM